MAERSLVLLKPDTVQRGLAGRVIGRLEDRGLKIVGIKMVHMDVALANRLYAEHVNKPFFSGLSEFMMSRPIIAIAVEGKNAAALVRATMGATDPQDALPTPWGRVSETSRSPNPTCTRSRSASWRSRRRRCG